MKNKLLTLGVLFLFISAAFNGVKAQTIGVSTNVLGWATATMNVGLEIGLAKKWSVEVDGFYNPFNLSNGRKTNIWGFQPEVKFWPRYRFAGHFVGLHGHYAMYDWGLWDFRYKGQLGGFGFSYGYAWMFHKRWNLEGTVGLGYTHLNHDDVYDRKDHQISYGPDTRNYWGLSRLGIKIAYFFK